MNENKEQARETIRRCRALRDAGSVEAVLRSEVQSALRVMFPAADDQTWINHYVEGAESHTKIGKAGGTIADRFIDNLIGSTTIEYESDLRNQGKRDEGFRQVREHAAGLIREGVAPSQVRGILSDTVEWYAYDAELAPGVEAASCTPDNVTLVLVDELQLPNHTADAAQRLVQFIRKHLAREQSRALRADLLALDLGLGSAPHQRSAPSLEKLVTDGRKVDPSIALATDLWSRFVDHLEAHAGAFRAGAYVDELYVGILAKLLSANVLADQAISSNDAQLKAILDGSYFRNNYQLENMVEQDYFGWSVQPGYIDGIVPIAREIQRDLYAYDIRRRHEQDLFGRLMAQLARRSQRKLLGQEWTPSWLAQLLAQRCIDNLPSSEAPRIIDMCCGSGSILAEIIKACRTKFGFIDIDALHDVATGFDIDPLAVSLSKTTWVVTLAAEIKAATAPIVIPVYHADSLFAVTPVSKSLPLLGESGPIPVSLDGTIINLPHVLVQPEYKDLFDRIVDWAYDEALDAKAKGHVAHISKEDTDSFLSGAVSTTGLTVDVAVEKPLREAVHALVRRMSELAIANRNGIWAFILRNTYRPSLLSGQFNGLVSNPPWLAMSGLADNPYRGVLSSRAKLYGIMPAGQSFLHLELGTTHLLHAVDRYLKPGASIACLVPGSILNGHHHEALRQREFLSSKRPVAFEINEVWQVAPGTFKYPGAALIGHKRSGTAKLKDVAIKGCFARSAGLEGVDFSIATIGTKRTAWLLEKQGVPVAASTAAAMPQQGADLMPRTAVCVEVLDKSGPEYRVDTPHQGSPWSFTVKASKELKAERFPGHVSPDFIHLMAQSENLLPFILGDNRAPIAIPAMRAADGRWRIYDEPEIRKMGLIQTTRRFQAINKKLVSVGQGKSLQARIDERGKLQKQALGKTGSLVLAGAGGKHICAACVPVADADRLVIDQTLYWQVYEDENEAWYRVGMLNSHAMTEAIMPFNPKGDFGERHVHTLPYRLMPAYAPSNDDHVRIATLARELSGIVAGIVKADAYLCDASRSLPVRRGRIRKQLSSTNQYQELETLCATALGTTAFGDDSEAAISDDAVV
jgi:methylase of polypeptide subunit release factors